MSYIGSVISEMFEEFDGRMDARGIGILIAHMLAFGSGERNKWSTINMRSTIMPHVHPRAMEKSFKQVCIGALTNYPPPI